MDIKTFAEKAKRYVENRDFSDQANAELRLYNLKMRISRIELKKREFEAEFLDQNIGERWDNIMIWCLPEVINSKLVINFRSFG